MSYFRTIVAVSLASIAIACGGTADPDAAGGGNVITSGGESALSVTNNSSYDIYYLHMSSTADPNWGPDHLGSAILRSGSTFTLQGVPCGSYDIKLIDEDRDECEIRNAYMCSDSVLTITNDQLLACEGYR